MSSPSVSSVIEENVYQVFYNIRHGWLGLFVLLGAILYIDYISQTSTPNIQIWASLVSLMALGHGIIVNTFLYQHRNRNIFAYHKWGWAIAIYSLAVGSAISLGACLVFDNESIGWAYFLVALIIMPGFGSAVTSTSFLPVHIGWVLGTNLPLSLFLLMQDQADIVAMGLLILFTAIPMMILIGIGYKRMYKRNIALRMENIELINNLKIKADIATRSNQDKSRFLAAASHDLRQPHQALGLFLESLDYMESEPKKKEILNKSKQAFQAMNNLLNQLLDISKLDAGTIEMNIQPLKLQPLLHHLVMEYMPQADKKGIELRLRPTSAVVYADPVMLNRILSNLISNAIRYTSSGGILLLVCKRGDDWRIDLWDTGCGIPSNKTEDIFQEFTQLENPERDREKGLGLGLSIVQRLTHMMGTNIIVRSRLGKGSCFSITLPSSDDAASIEIESSQPINTTPLQALTVVIIDDDKLARDGLNVLLNVWGCRVLPFSSEKECLSSLDETDTCPDALIVDYRLRDNKTGAEAIKAICQYYNANIPALMITGDTAPTRIKEARKSNFPLLHKPVNASELKSFLLNIGLENCK